MQRWGRPLEVRTFERLLVSYARYELRPSLACLILSSFPTMRVNADGRASFFHAEGSGIDSRTLRFFVNCSSVELGWIQVPGISSWTLNSAWFYQPRSQGHRGSQTRGGPWDEVVDKHGGERGEGHLLVRRKLPKTMLQVSLLPYWIVWFNFRVDQLSPPLKL